MATNAAATPEVRCLFLSGAGDMVAYPARPQEREKGLFLILHMPYDVSPLVHRLMEDDGCRARLKVLGAFLEKLPDEERSAVQACIDHLLATTHRSALTEGFLLGKQRRQYTAE